jgi:hypothetical protein
MKEPFLKRTHQEIYSKRLLIELRTNL